MQGGKGLFSLAERPEKIQKMEMWENGCCKVGEEEDNLEIFEREEKLESLLNWYGLVWLLPGSFK